MGVEDGGVDRALVLIEANGVMIDVEGFEGNVSANFGEMNVLFWVKFQKNPMAILRCSAIIGQFPDVAQLSDNCGTPQNCQMNTSKFSVSKFMHSHI